MNQPSIDFKELYSRFNAPISDIDCGKLCAPHNPSGKPFCCDVCKAVPVAYNPEWDYLRKTTSLWHPWLGDECAEEVSDPSVLEGQTPEHLQLLACKGPAFCEREYRAISCRQFPFFPYITADFRFIGLACDWDFTGVCWVLSHLEKVSGKYRLEFITAFDNLFSFMLEDLDAYFELSEEMRENFKARRKRIPLLHRNGNDYLISPGSGQLRRTDLKRLQGFGIYK